MKDASISPEAWQNCVDVLTFLSSKSPRHLEYDDEMSPLIIKLYKMLRYNNKKQKSNALILKKVMSISDLPFRQIQKIILDQDQTKQYDQNILSGTQRVAHYFNTPKLERLGSSNMLLKPIKCYICKTQYTEVHFFYHSLCPECAVFNYQKRLQQVNLKGRIALVTGGRVKIGFMTALYLLRSGAKVWVTSRFAKDCALRFSRELDFDIWKDQLQIIGLDFRNIFAVQEMIHMLNQSESHLDIIINNAAQTIQKPIAFYHHLVDFEQSPISKLPQPLQNILAFNHTPFQLMHSSWEQKMLPYDTEKYFPKDQLDKDNQQIDKREINSWKLSLDEVKPLELLETQLINVTAPFLINSQLKSLLIKSPFTRRFIINVSAMEGVFSRAYKPYCHPHTNMAKAALNMMTRTSAQDYARDQIYMNSVDTGWVTNENPYPEKIHLEMKFFIPPLDEIDAMARICDPIVMGIVDESRLALFGHFLKNYRPHSW